MNEQDFGRALQLIDCIEQIVQGAFASPVDDELITQENALVLISSMIPRFKSDLVCDRIADAKIVYGEGISNE